MKMLLAVGVALALAQPALGQTVLETDFTISVPQGSGDPLVESTTLVPLLEGACYHWHIRLGKTKGAVEVTEIYTLPAAPDNWGFDENNPVTLSDDQRIATSIMSLTPDEGWIGHGWCITEGDPAGDYSFEIKASDKVLATFDFELQAM